MTLFSWVSVQFVFFSLCCIVILRCQSLKNFKHSSMWQFYDFCFCVPLAVLMSVDSVQSFSFWFSCFILMGGNSYKVFKVQTLPHDDCSLPSILFKDGSLTGLILWVGWAELSYSRMVIGTLSFLLVSWEKRNNHCC